MGALSPRRGLHPLDSSALTSSRTLHRKPSVTVLRRETSLEDLSTNVMPQAA